MTSLIKAPLGFRYMTMLLSVTHFRKMHYTVSALECNEDLQTMKIEEDFRLTLKRIFLPKKERNQQKNKQEEWGQENVLL